MGYYTDFELEIQNVDKVENIGESVKELCPDLVDSIEYNSGDAEYEVKSGFVVFNSKWYDRQKEMTALSKRHPELNIRIYCEGEDGERWVEYYKGGKFEEKGVKTVFEETTLW